MQTKIFIIRHGQSIGNAWHRYLGHTDLGLTELGKMQAQQTAAVLSKENIDAIYSSDLKRAHETALPLSKILGIDIVDSKELREIFLGEWEGALIHDLKTLHYKEFVLDWGENFGSFTFPGGESVIAAADRFYKEVKRIADENLGKNIVITSHAAVIRAFWCKISGVCVDEMASAVPFPTNSSYSTLTYDGREFSPVSFSIDGHVCNNT